MFAITGLDKIGEFRKQIKLEMARLDREVTTTYEGWTKRVFTGLVEGTAQWSGNLAANWNYAVGAPSMRYVQVPNKTGHDKGIDYIKQDFGVFFAGHPLAVEEALVRMAGVTVPTWRDQVFFSNETPDDKGGYLEESIMEGKVRLRPVNLINGAAVTLDTILLAESQRATP